MRILICFSPFFLLEECGLQCNIQYCPEEDEAGSNNAWWSSLQQHCFSNSFGSNFSFTDIQLWHPVQEVLIYCLWYLLDLFVALAREWSGIHGTPLVVYAASLLLKDVTYMTKDCMLSVISGWKIQWRNEWSCLKLLTILNQIH